MAAAMKRSAVRLDEILAWPNLFRAFYHAAAGKRLRPAVRTFEDNLDHELGGLASEIREGRFAFGQTRAFRIRDPKPRLIHAPCFRERVVHHAIIAYVGPLLDRAQIDDSFACRRGKGTLAAVKRCQHHLRRFPYFGKIDIRAYFASIDHQHLIDLLHRRLKDTQVLDLLERVIKSHETTPGKGLPIGSLTSQHFANAYLGRLDRFLLERCRVRGMVRYMDDVIWWQDDRAAVRQTLAKASDFLKRDLLLDVKTPPGIGDSRHGLSFCGYRILPGALLLSRRRKRRYAELRRAYERNYEQERIDEQQLQAGYSTAFALTAHADAAAWRREQLRRQPLEPMLAHV